MTVGRSVLFRRAVLGLWVPLALSTALVAIQAVLSVEEQYPAMFAARSARNVRLLADAVVPAVSDPARAHAVLHSLERMPELTYAALVAADGAIIAAVGERRSPANATPRTDADRTLRLQAPVSGTEAVLSADFRPEGLIALPIRLIVAVLVGGLIVAGGIFAALIGRKFDALFTSLLFPMQRAVPALRGLVDQLTKAARDQIRSVNESRNGLATLEATLGDVATHSNQALHEAQSLAAAGAEVELLSEQAVTAVADASASLAVLQRTLPELDNALGTLSDRALTVATISSNVQLLAERSNLLALNAAMEAARTGADRRGFAVVSREMKGLADGSRSAASQVQSIIAGIRTALSRALTDAEETSARIVNARQRMDHALTRMNIFAGLADEMVALAGELSSRVGGQDSSTARMMEAMALARQGGSEQGRATNAILDSATFLAGLSSALDDQLAGKALLRKGAERGQSLRRGGAAARALSAVIRRMLVPYVSGIALIAAFIAPILESTPRQRLQKNASQLADGVGLLVLEPLRLQHPATLQQFFERLAVTDDLSEARIVGPRGRLFAFKADPEGTANCDAKERRTVGDHGEALELCFRLPLRKRLFGGILLIIYVGGTAAISLAAALIYRSGRSFGQVFERVYETIRQVSEKLNETVARLASVAGQYASAAQGVADAVAGGQNLASSLREQSLLATTASESLARRRQVAGTAASSALLAITEARGAVVLALEQMTGTRGAVIHFSGRAAAVAGIAGTVSKLAGKSNLLAINAALEASRAAEEGFGFAVVAREMSTLAAGTKASAGEVQSVIEEVRATIDNAVETSSAGEKQARVTETQAEQAVEHIRALSVTIAEFQRRVAGVAVSAQRQDAAMAHCLSAIERSRDESRSQVRAAGEVERVAQQLVELSNALVAVLEAQA